jgi:AbiV family abortive infection protein
MQNSYPRNLSPAIRASFENGSRLVDDSQHLLEYECFPSAYALAILAQEEYAKAFLLILVQGKSIPWNADVCQALRNHSCKQLVATIMEYLDAEWEKYLATLKVRGSVNFPPHIADAINIIRHEKVPREDASAWLWDDKSHRDPDARRISEGKFDKQKQNALYVDVGKSGQVSVPNHSKQLIHPVKGLVYADVGDKDSFSTGMGMHGAAGEREIHNFCAATGPDFRRGYVDLNPTSSIDVAPTIARILGTLPNVGPHGVIPTGRVMTEALLDGNRSAGGAHTQSMTTKLELQGVDAVATIRVTWIGDEPYLDGSTSARVPLGSSP